MTPVNELLEPTLFGTLAKSILAGGVIGVVLTQLFTRSRENAARVVRDKTEAYVGAIESQQTHLALLAQIERLEARFTELCRGADMIDIAIQRKKSDLHIYISQTKEEREVDPERRSEIMATLKDELDELLKKSAKQADEIREVLRRRVDAEIRLEENRHRTRYWSGRVEISGSRAAIRALDLLRNSGPENEWAHDNYIQSVRQDLAWHQGWTSRATVFGSWLVHLLSRNNSRVPE